MSSALSSPPDIRGAVTVSRQQSGVVLIVSLVLLLIMTLLGVSNMRTSTAQLNMAVNTQARSEVFSAAEFTLKTVQAELQSNFANKHDPDRFIKNCSGSGCYDAGCTGGFCYEGDSDWNSPPECSLDDGHGTLEKEFIWVRDAGAVWKDSGRHATKQLAIPRGSHSASGGSANNILFQSKYIIEFLCYTHKDSDPEEGGLCDVLSPRGCVPLYRITVLAEGQNNESRVMLQATTKIRDN